MSTETLWAICVVVGVVGCNAFVLVGLRLYVRTHPDQRTYRISAKPRHPCVAEARARELKARQSLAEQLFGLPVKEQTDGK